MIYPVEADIIQPVESTIEGLQPYAKANHVHLGFTSAFKELKVRYHPFLLIQSLSRVVCNIISLVPHETEVQVRMSSCIQSQQLILEIENTGINLLRVNSISADNTYSFKACPLTNGSIYRLIIPLHTESSVTINLNGNSTTINSFPKFYAEIKKRLRSHFTQAEKLVAALEHNRPMEAAFLQKINTLIQANLHNETFDTTALCNAMAMSRTQLFRKLKPLIRQAPANYIKTMRLQRAKEFLETTDMTVSEVAYKTGFQTVSNFTKVFQHQYSVLPSVCKRNKPATNE